MSPFIFNVFKPAGLSSYDVVRHFKRNLPGDYGKIGHFGTLDPFACGVLMIGVSGAMRLNEYIHDLLPKTYLAIGKLGISTDTGDHQGKITGIDETPYLKREMADWTKEFIEDQIQKKFLGEYWQSPHQFSASKFEGKALYEWAREGVEIKKEQKRRFVHSIEVVRYQHPYLSIRFTVSSGTYIRTLFEEVSNFLGTHGHLIGLLREAVGTTSYKEALKKSMWPIKGEELSYYEKYGFTPKKVLPLTELKLTEEEALAVVHGRALTLKSYETLSHGWAIGPSGEVLGMAKIENNQLVTLFNFPRK